MKNLLMTKSSDGKSDLVKGPHQDRIKVLVNIIHVHWKRAYQMSF